jgi:hypothetical protein
MRNNVLKSLGINTTITLLTPKPSIITKCDLCDAGVIIGGEYVCEHTCLQATFPIISKEWDYDKNNMVNEHGDKITPLNTTCNSLINVAWICKNCKCHPWLTSIFSRTHCNAGCTLCSYNLYCAHTSFAGVYPKLLLEYDLDKNTENPHILSPTYKSKLHWKCKNNTCGCHLWQATIKDRLLEKSPCPFCSYDKICLHNNLSSTYPELIKEFSTKNNKDPSTISPKCTDIMIWKCLKCKCGCHEWKATIHYKLSYPNCPYCSTPTEVCQHDSFATKCSQLMPEWDYERNTCDPMKISTRSHYRLYFKCLTNPNHLWDTTAYNRVKTNGYISNCPHCVRQYSRKQINWLNWIMKRDNIHIKHAENDGEYYIKGIGYVDGYCEETRTVYQFHGNYWHGNPKMYQSDKTNPTNGKTYGELYQRTIDREKLVRDLGYNLVTIWEQDFDNLMIEK